MSSRVDSHPATMIGQTRSLRRLAVYVLLAWLFALTTGFVNACIVQAEVSDSAHSVAHPRHAGDHGHAYEMSAGPHESQVAHPPCERFCDEPSALPQPAKLQADASSGLWFAYAPLSSFFFQALSEPDATLGSRDVRQRSTIPIPIAFLRLTL
jgi:hypothetical protein